MIEKLVLSQDILGRVDKESSARQSKNIVLILCTCALSSIM